MEIVPRDFLFFVRCIGITVSRGSFVPLFGGFRCGGRCGIRLIGGKVPLDLPVRLLIADIQRSLVTGRKTLVRVQNGHRGKADLIIQPVAVAQQYPDVQVVLHEAPVPELGKLAEGRVLDFCVMQIPEDLTDLTYELVMQERVFLVGHREHPLLRGIDSPYSDPKPFRDLRLLEREAR